MHISMTVNGKHYTADVEPRLLLVDFLRDTLKLTGTKIGCDTGRCGTCIIQVNGELATSCAMLAVQADSAEIVTIEGVSAPGKLTDLQASLWEKHGLQCGFCTPGVIMVLNDLLAKDPLPGEQQIRSSLEGSLCRCTGYHSIVRAVQATVEKAQAAKEIPAAPALTNRV